MSALIAVIIFAVIPFALLAYVFRLPKDTFGDATGKE